MTTEKVDESGVVPSVRWADPPVNFVSEKTEKTEMASPVAEKGKVEDRPPMASICKLFSLMDWKEALILTVGLLGAIGNGVTQPIVLIVFGDLIDGMGGSTVPIELPANVTPEQMSSLMEGMMDGMMDEMERLCITMCIIGVANTVAATLQGACFKIFSDMQTKKFRIQYFKNVLFQDVSWFDLKEVAALPSEINDDLEKISDAFGDKLGNGVMSFSAFIGGFACAFGLGWLVALVMCAMLPFMGIGAAIMGKAVQEIMLESQSWYTKAACVVEECLYSMRTVVAFGGERRELQKFQYALVQTRSGGVRNGFKIGIGLGYTVLVIFAGNALAFWFGMTLRYHDQVNPATGRPWEPGNILAIFFCVFTGSFCIGNLDPSIKALQSARFAAGRFFQVKHNRPQVQCGDVDKRQDIQSIETFSLRDVHFFYPARPDVKILNGLTLDISRGQKVAVVGESGSGKSTVMALLERFYDPSSGMVLVNGQDMKTFKVASLRRCIGYVGQEPVLFAGSIHHNIMQGNPSATKEDFARACADAQLAFVESLPEKYNTFVGAGGGQLSGGQKQRIAIARALVKHASFLFLDEATSALDNASEKMIQQTIDHLDPNSAAQSGGLGIVSIAHRLSTVRHAERIYVLSRGALVESGTHASLMELKGTYFALVAAQEAAQGVEDEAADVQVTEEQQQKRLSEHSTESEGQRRAKEKKEEEDRLKEINKNYKVPMGRLLSYNRPEWPFFVPAVLGALVDGSVMPLSCVALVGAMKGFYKVDKEEMRQEMEMMAWLFLIIGASGLVGCAISHGCFSILGEAMTQRLRVAILTSIFRQELGFHDDPQHAPGMLSKALELWAYRVAQLCKSIQAKAAAMSSLVIGLCLAFIYCWQMALIMLGSIPVMVLANAVQMVMLLGAAKSENENLTNAQQIVTDSVMNARTVQALGVEHSLVAMYASWVQKAMKGAWLHNVFAGVGFGVSSGIMFFIMAGGFYLAAMLIQDGVADFEGVMMAFMGIFYAGAGAGQAAIMVGDASKAKVACHDMFQLMDRASLIEGLDPTGETPQELDAGTIEFVDVKFFYPFRPAVQVLKGINFRIASGTSVGLVGPSGGGKSTVMCLLQRFYDPQEGHVYIGAQRRPLASLNIRWWRKQIGFVGQEPVLFNSTVRENVLYGHDEGEEISEDYIKKCEEMCNLGFLYKDGNQGLNTEVGPRGGRLSGGQKQRVAICRALLRDPKVLLLDEATSALDSQSEAVVQQALEKALQGRTSFAIAHRLSTVQGCDLILVNADGRVVESGTHGELMALKGVYYQLQRQSQK